MTSTTHKPIATQRIKHRYKTLKMATANGDKIEKVRVHVGEEVVRTAHCWKHNIHTTTFIGVNKNGWVFGCPGIEPIPGKFDTEPAHYFIAEPAVTS